MKKKRIVKETLASGKTYYCVEVAKGIFGIPLFWTPDTIPDPMYPDTFSFAMFSTLEKACEYCGFNEDSIIRRTTIVKIK